MIIFQVVRSVIRFIKSPKLPKWNLRIPAGYSKYLAGGAMVIVCFALIGRWLQSDHNAQSEQTWFASKLRIPSESIKYIPDDSLFKATLVDMGHRLDMNPSWILAVMFHESRLNPAARNFKGSGATGLIQFMGPALKDINQRLRTGYYLSDVRNMDAVSQLVLVEEYYEMVQERYGKISTFPDAYLAVLFPRAIGQSPEHVLFSRPGRRYSQNSGLDLNRDGHITVGDISNRLYTMFPDLAEVGHSSLASGK